MNHQERFSRKDFPFQNLQFDFMLHIVVKLINHPSSAPFRDPVLKITEPFYSDIIQNPIDLNTIKKKLICHEYTTTGDCMDDLQRIFYNCALFYDKDHETFKKMLVLKDVFMNILNGIHSVVHDLVSLLVSVDERSEMIRRCDKNSPNSTITLIVRDMGSRDKPIESDIMVIDGEKMLRGEATNKKSEKERLKMTAGGDNGPVALIVRNSNSDTFDDRSRCNDPPSKEIEVREPLQSKTEKLPDTLRVATTGGTYNLSNNQTSENHQNEMAISEEEDENNSDPDYMPPIELSDDGDSVSSDSVEEIQVKPDTQKKDKMINQPREGQLNPSSSTDLCSSGKQTSKTEHHNSRDIYVCEDCNICFATTRSFFSHRRWRHKDKKTFFCFICSKSFQRRDAYKLHLRKHDFSEVKRVTPDSLFSDVFQDELKNMKTYKCKMCDKSFMMKSHLDEHQNTVHLQYRPHICTECGVVFGKLYNLKRHKRIHTGFKEFKCPVCQKEFNQKSHLDTHVKSLHQNFQKT